MSFYSVPDDMMSGKSWNQMLADNMKALGMPDLPLPELPSPDFKMPLIAGSEIPAAMAQNAAALAMMPFGLAATMMGAFAGPWAAAMDGAIAATRQMASLTPALPEFTAGMPAAATGEVLAFTPKEKPSKASKSAKTVLDMTQDEAPAADAASEDPAAAPDSVAVDMHGEVTETPAAPVEAHAPVLEAPAFAPAVVEQVAAPGKAPTVQAFAAPVAAPKPAKGGLLDLVAVDDAPVVEEVPGFAAVAETITPSAELSPEDFKRPAGITRPESPDDLKMISGVGPKIEGILHGLGIYTFAQVAGWKAAEVAWVDDYLNFKGRITRDGWIAQADALAAGGRDEYVRRFGKEPR